MLCHCRTNTLCSDAFAHASARTDARPCGSSSCISGTYPDADSRPTGSANTHAPARGGACSSRPGPNRYANTNAHSCPASGAYTPARGGACTRSCSGRHASTDAVPTITRAAKPTW